MSVSRRELEVELAEVAAGRRARPNASTMGQVSTDEYRLEQANKRFQTDSLEIAARTSESAARHAEAAERTADAQREAAEASREMLDVARRTQERQERHQELMQELEESRNEAMTEHFDALQALEHERNEDLRAAMGRQAEEQAREQQRVRAHRERIEDLEDARARREADRDHRDKIRQSPSYFAAVTLLELRALERPIRERAELESLLAEVPDLLEAAREVATLSDADEVARKHSFECAEQERIDELVKANQQKAAAAQAAFAAEALLLNERLSGLRTRCEELELARSAQGVSLNPLSWTASRARERAKFEEELAETRVAIAEAEADSAALTSEYEAAATEAAAAPLPVPARFVSRHRIERLAATFERHPVAAAVAELEAGLQTWFNAADRSEATAELLGKMPSP